MSYATADDASRALALACRRMARNGVSEPSLPMIDYYNDGRYGYAVTVWHGSRKAVGYLTDHSATWYNPGTTPTKLTRRAFWRKLDALTC